jgi:hypothetical protein
MLLINKPNGNYTARQLKLPLEIEKLINISDPVYTFCEVMNHGFCSLREIEKLCRTDIRYMYLLDEMKAPSFATFGNFIRNELTDTIEQIFADGNKRIAATMFLYFLDKNGILFADGNKLIDDHTLVALTIMIAESKPDEKEMMISVIMNCICG